MDANIFQIARMQVDSVKSVLANRFAFEDNNTNEVQSGYTTYGTMETPTTLIVVRVSNHICSMNNWTERYKPKLIPNKKLARRMGKNLQEPYKERCFFSIVFKAFDYATNDVGKWKAVCNEYVFNPLEVEKEGTIGNIANDCLKLNSNRKISINGQNPTQRIAKKASSIENNQEIKENKKMNKKQIIRINETQLRQIVTESVKMIVTEISNNAPKEKYTWHIFECDENFENNSELYNSYNESDAYNQMGFTTPEEAYNDAMKFVNFYKNDFKHGKYSVEIFGKEDFVMGFEIDNGRIIEF